MAVNIGMNTNCKAAFNDILIDANGDLLPCCYIERPLHKKKISQVSGLKDWFFNDKNLQSLRKNLSSNIKDSRCDECWRAEADNKWSLRSSKPFDSNTADVKLIHLTGGRLCNMACRMCTPGLSSMIKTEERPWQENYEVGSVVNWIDDPVQSKKIIELINTSNIESIQLSGGEPQLIKGFVTVLESIDPRKKSMIDLQVTTNASVFNQRFWQQAVKFNRVTAGLSIDAVGSRYEIIRYHGKWNTVKENCEKILEYIWQNRIDPGPNPALNLNIVTQLSNVDLGDEMNKFYTALGKKFEGISCSYTLAHVGDGDVVNPWDLPNISPEVLEGIPDQVVDSPLAKQWQNNVDYAKANNLFNNQHRERVLARETYFKKIHGKNLWDEKPEWYKIYSERVE